MALRSVKFTVRFKSILQYVALVFLIPGLLLLSTVLPSDATLTDASLSRPLDTVPATGEVYLAQRTSSLDLWQRVYELLPDLPREDQYISVETGQQATTSNLISRLIRYHTFIKGRSPNYRFDWKLTLADYLGVNELIRSAGYPGYDTLTANPLRGDVAAVSGLTRAQRDALVNALVRVFTTSTNSSSPAPNPSPTPRNSPAPTSSPVAPVAPQPPIPQPRPGDAQLLRL